MLLVFVDFPHSVSLPSPHPFPHLNVSVLNILPTSFHVACIVLLSPWFCPRKDPFLVSHDLHMREKKQCFSFWVRVTSLNSNILQLHAHSWISYDFIFLYLLIKFWYIYIYIILILIIHSSAEADLDWFHFLSVENGVAIEVGVLVSL